MTTSKLLIELHNKGQTNTSNLKITFGKYRGYCVKDVPVDYLKWILLNHDNNNFCEIIKDELLRREPKWQTQ